MNLDSNADSDHAPLGIFGGTFDPVHMGHLRLAEEARDLLGLAGVVWIPAGQPPHRAQPRTHPLHRLAMVQLAVAGNPQFSVDAWEVEATGPSYTVETLRHLRQRFGAGRPLTLLLGADAFMGLSSWHAWREVAELAHVAVLHRPGVLLNPSLMPVELAAAFDRHYCPEIKVCTQRAGGCFVSLAMTQLDISATRIREMLQQQSSPRYLLPEPVLDYIRQHHLYL